MIVQVLYLVRNEITGNAEGFDHVADVDAPFNDATKSIEYAFRRLQNLDGSWSMGETIEGFDNPDYDSSVIVLKPLHRDASGHLWGHRSCSIFDRMIVDGKTYEVDCIGFKEV